MAWLSLLFRSFFVEAGCFTRDASAKALRSEVLQGNLAVAIDRGKFACLPPGTIFPFWLAVRSRATVTRTKKIAVFRPRDEQQKARDILYVKPRAVTQRFPFELDRKDSDATEGRKARHLTALDGSFTIARRREATEQQSSPESTVATKKKWKI